MSTDKAPRNRTLTVNDDERSALLARVCRADRPLALFEIENRTFNADLPQTIDFFPAESVDLMIIDPPYNLHKDFHGLKFSESSDEAYLEYLESWFPRLIRLLKPDASLYICCDWKSSSAVYRVANRYLTVRNRITWQREKGRGAKANWKNCTEDIWFATVSDSYFFDIDAVKMKRKVIAPYKVDGRPKDWEETDDGNFRLTHPSNFWDDITVPYWSMPENTDHPTQKPEKLIAKLILASCPEGGLVFDPFLGSGTTSVAAKKLGRRYCGIEVNEEYCCWAEKRLEKSQADRKIQGYVGGVFWERNSLSYQKDEPGNSPAEQQQNEELSDG